MKFKKLFVFRDQFLILLNYTLFIYHKILKFMIFLLTGSFLNILNHFVFNKISKLYFFIIDFLLNKDIASKSNKK